MNQQAPWERTFEKVVTPFEEFIHHESTSGLLLMGCAIVALILANSPLYHTYEHIHEDHYQTDLSFDAFIDQIATLVVVGAANGADDSLGIVA